MVASLFQPFPMVKGRRAQVWRHQPQFRRPRHFHEEPEINVVVKGSGLMGVGERNHRILAGDLLLFQPGQDHGLLEASDDFQLFVMAVRPELADRALGAGAALGSSTFRLSPESLPELATKLSELWAIRDAHDHEAQVTELFRSLRAAMPAEGHALTRRALRCVVGEPGVSVSTLARRFRTTPSSVSRHYHRDLGVTLTEHRARMRLMRFVRMVDGGMELTEAALAASFGSYAQFHRAFRRAFGCAPRQYFSGLRTLMTEATLASIESGDGPWARPFSLPLP